MITIGLHGRRWEIFSSAVDLFSIHGYENVSVKEIAKVNGIKAASFYNHFPSKESLLDHMFRFYYENITDSPPALEELLVLVPEKSPKELLHKAMGYYSEELQPYMDKIYMIAILQAHRDPKAYDVVWNYNIENSRQYLRAIFEKMVALGKIAPLDVESFIELFTSFAFTAIFRNRSHNPLGLDGWVKGLDMLFSIPQELSDSHVKR